MIDLARLAKLLALSTSPVDAEALAAIRRANAIVSEAGETWEAVLRPAPPGAQRRLPQRVRWQGRDYDPPVGETWQQSVAWLAQRDAGRCQRERRQIADLARKLASAAALGVVDVTGPEAAFIDGMWRSLAGLPE